MEGEKEWFCRWSERKNKVFYVNIKSRQSSWVKPQGFVESEDELKKISEWKERKRKLTSENTQTPLNGSDSEEKKEKSAPLNSRIPDTSDEGKSRKTGKKRPPSRSSDTPSKKSKMTSDLLPDNIADHAGDYVQVFSEKRQIHYYYNMKTKTSQWKRPACFQAAETEKAIENANLKKFEVERNMNSNNGNPDFNLNETGALSDEEEEEKEEEDLDNDKSILSRSTLNVHAPCFEMSSKLNVNAKPFVPRPLEKTSSCFDLTETDRKSEDSSTEKPIMRPRNGKPKRKVILSRRSDPTPSRKTLKSPNHARVSAKERLSLSAAKSSRSVHDRLGTRTPISPPDTFLLSDVESNVLIPEVDLIQLSDSPPHPECEIRRYSEVQALRKLFSDLCQEELGLEEPTEALNRWLLEQKLNCTEHIDPFFSFSDNKTTVSMYREIMEDVPTKYKLPRQVKTCLKTLEKFVQKMKDLALEWGEENIVEKKCAEVLKKNVPNSNTRNLMAELRESCREVIERHFKIRVDQVCQRMNDQCRESAVKVMEFAREEGLDGTLPPRPASTSTRLVGCRPAMPLVCDSSVRGADVSVTVCGTDKDSSCRITYQGNLLSVNRSHYQKLKKLYETANVDRKEEDDFNSRVWCLLKRYKMLRSSIGGTKLCQENFGLHAALPHKAFDLLNRKFRVTFECFASPFNCYFSQYCSAFPDIDCYFGSRGSFFEFRPKSGSFQANPPFSEEVMLAMAEHMISLLNDSQQPLRFVIFIPDWRVPLTPAIPRLENTIYLTHNILLTSKSHQYITGNQHLQSITHYDAVHGTQVYVLQNDAASDEWPLTDDDMEHLRDAMSYNREWN